MQLDLFEELVESSIKGVGLVCIKCKKTKPLNSFGNASGGKYKNTTCRRCTNKNSRTVKGLYLSVAPPSKDHACPICLRKAGELHCPTKPNKSVWSLDHDHVKGTFRGWLCHRCNRGIGMIGDSVENTQRLLNYLKENE